VQWLSEYKGEGFDYIVDDLFGHLSNDVIRSNQLDTRWLNSLCENLNSDGTIVCNCESTKQLRSSLSAYRGHGFVEAYSWQLPNYENAIGVFLREAIDNKAWSRHLGQSNLTPTAKTQAQKIKRGRTKLRS